MNPESMRSLRTLTAHRRSWTRTRMASSSGAGAVEVHRGQGIGERYVALRPLGAGGMGTVWEVEHRMLGRRFALKLLRHPNTVAQPDIARLRREARTAAAIDHPNVVRVLDYQVDEVVGPFIVMELLRGDSLWKAMSAGKAFALTDALQWVEPVARALDAIHARGLVHRDVKPENVVRAGRGDAPCIVKLVDFGLATYADGRDRLTREGVVLGTPRYFAPEVAEGEPASRASDVYSLAVMAFELLTGTLPHEGGSALEVVRAKLETPAPSLSERSGRLFAVPIELAFREALELDPARRQSSATAFAERLALCARR